MGYDCITDDVRNAAILELEAIDERYIAVEREHELKRIALRQHLELQYAALLERRREALLRPPSDANIDHAQATPAIPGFWRTVLQNSAEFQEEIERHDEPVLDYLRDIRTEWLDPKSFHLGFRVRFIFSPNPYFSNPELEKVYYTERNHLYADRLECVKVQAPPILWHPGRDVTVDVVSKKAKGTVRRRSTKPRKEEVPRASFFRTCFRNLGPDEEIPEEELEADDGSADVMDCLVEDDFEQGLALRDHLVPHAVRWYTGEACEDEEDGACSQSEEGEGTEEESDEGDDEGEEEGSEEQREQP